MDRGGPNPLADLSVFQICLCFWFSRFVCVSELNIRQVKSDTLIKRVIFADSTSLQKRSPRKTQDGSLRLSKIFNVIETTCYQNSFFLSTENMWLFSFRRLARDHAIHSIGKRLMRNVSLLWIKSLLVNAHSHHIHSIHPSTAKGKTWLWEVYKTWVCHLPLFSLDDPISKIMQWTVVLGVK